MAVGNAKKRDIKIRTSYDEMEAYLMLPVLSSGDDYTFEEVMEAVRRSKVKIDVDETAIRNLIDFRSYGKEIVIAKGKPKVDGQDGFFEFNLNLDFNRKPLIRPDGSVDYFSIHMVEIVEKGQIIAEYHPPVEGVNGLAVTGKPLPAKRGKALPPLVGKGFDRSDDNLVYTANMTGKVDKQGNRINILPVYEVHGDADLSTGNIDFRGDVIIHGNVTNGMSIKATGIITVDGVSECCKLEAGKDIILRGGFLGGYKGKLFANGNIYAKFLEYGYVECEGNVECTSALSCKIIAYNKIIINGTNNNIVGGYLYGTAGIEAKNCGNSNEIKTHLEAGSSTQLLKEYTGATDHMNKVADMLEKIKTGIAQFDEIAAKKNIDGKKDQRRIDLVRAKIEKQAELSAASLSVNRYETLLDRAKDATVKIDNFIYPGTRISINSVDYVVVDRERSIEFKEYYGKILAFRNN